MTSKKNKNRHIEILIAEDSRTQAEQLQLLLEEHGYTVTTAPNGMAALTQLRLRQPALVISDIMMPELDGYGLCRALKSDEKLKSIPVMLVTTLSDPQDVIRGLECGADNFIRKPYDERYLLSRINYLLINLELRKNQKMQIGVEIKLGDQKFFINSERQQILDLLISTYEQAVQINDELKLREHELAHSNQVLQGLYRIDDGLNHVSGEQEVAETALKRVVELPGVQAGLICLREGDTGLRLAAAQNLPAMPGQPDALENGCVCQYPFDSEEAGHASNATECDGLCRAEASRHGQHYHASVPLCCDGKAVGLMKLVGPQERMFGEEELKVLYGVGNQIAVALERASLNKNLEQRVLVSTAALRQSESWFRAVFNSQQDAVFVTAEDGLIINVNSAAEKMFGYSVEELKGQPVSLIQVNEQHHMEVLKRVQQAISQNSVVHFEHELMRRNGEIFPSEHTLSPLRSETGTSKGVVRVIRDITQRKQAEAKLTLFRTLLDNSSDAIEVLDPATLHFFAMNETGCRALGYSREELLSSAAPVAC